MPSRTAFLTSCTHSQQEEYLDHGPYCESCGALLPANYWRSHAFTGRDDRCTDQSVPPPVYLATPWHISSVPGRPRSGWGSPTEMCCLDHKLIEHYAFPSLHSSSVGVQLDQHHIHRANDILISYILQTLSRAHELKVGTILSRSLSLLLQRLLTIPDLI